MNRRLLISGLLVLLLAGFAALYASTAKKALPPPAATPMPALEQKMPDTQENSPDMAKQKPEEDTDAPNEDVNEKPAAVTVQGQLKKSQLVDKEEQPDTSITLKKEKQVKEVLPGVTIEDKAIVLPGVLPGVTLTDKEVTIPLEKANESLHIRREANDQTQLLFKQKF